MENGRTSRFSLIFPALCLLFLSGTVIRAEFRIVTTLADSDDGVCDAHCSLREAVVAAFEGDTVIFERNLRGGTIYLQSTLVIEKSLKIDGPNRRRITLKGNGTFGIVRVMGRSLFLPDVLLDGLVVRNGFATNGGGVYQNPSSVLTISDCLITKNHASVGGGIRVFGGVLYLFNSTISDNTSNGSGGAAGIDSFSAPGLHIINSTIAGNIAADGAGGIKSQPESLYLLNSTVSGNISRGNGFGRVGGIFTYQSGNFNFDNSVIAGNTGETSDVLLWSSSGENNLIGIGEGSRFSNGIGGNVVGTRKNPADPQLGQLMDNGRGLPTFAPFPGSLVVNAGSNERLTLYESLGYPFFSSTTDQRGFSRITGKAIDIGAVEYGGSAVPLTTTITGRVTNNGRGVSRGFVTIRDTKGETRTAVTNPFGYYRIVGLPVDTQFTVEVRNKRYSFQPQTLMTEETVEYLDFVAD